MSLKYRMMYVDWMNGTFSTIILYCDRPDYMLYYD
jgi:hypothetical protein